MAGPPTAEPPGARPTVAVVGRPNVGKSTLVNRLVGAREAIVQERAGITRDRTTHTAVWRGQELEVVDTGGWTRALSTGREPLGAAVAAQAERAAEQADVIAFVVDATVGPTEEDAEAARWLRRIADRVVLVANKVDDPRHVLEVGELYRLGLGDPVAVSALHGRGSGDLLDALLERLAAVGALAPEAEAGGAPPAELPGVALLGRPNVGKSSLFNRLVGEERAIVDERPGTTRDAVDTVLRRPDGAIYRFVDTAGLRRSRRGRDATEYYSSVRTVRALDAAAVALLVLDATETIGEQDQRLARQILDAGRALVLVLNKWDLVDDERRERVERERDRLLGFVEFAPLVRVSALTARGVGRILPAVDAVHAEWLRRVPTSEVNQWLADAVAATPPPTAEGRAVRLRYATQVAVGPPTFRVFGTGRVPDRYLRYLERRLRERFGFRGTPVRIGLRVRPGWEERSGQGKR